MEDAVNMVSYLVYDTQTGAVVHVHVEPAGSGTSPEEVIEMARPGGGEGLDVVELPGGQVPTRPLRVRGGRISEVDEDLPVAGGGVAGGFAEPAGERRYERRPPAS
jgi:hypothetical protein